MLIRSGLIDLDQCDIWEPLSDVDGAVELAPQRTIQADGSRTMLAAERTKSLDANIRKAAVRRLGL